MPTRQNWLYDQYIVKFKRRPTFPTQTTREVELYVALTLAQTGSLSNTDHQRRRSWRGEYLSRLPWRIVHYPPEALRFSDFHRALVRISDSCVKHQSNNVITTSACQSTSHMPPTVHRRQNQSLNQHLYTRRYDDLWTMIHSNQSDLEFSE